MYLPALPTFEQLKAACPVGPWPGDERMRAELEHLHFTMRLLNTLICHSGHVNEYRHLAKSLGIDKHSEMALDPRAREATSGMSPMELAELYLAQRITISNAEEAVLILADPHSGMAALLGAMAGASGRDGKVVIQIARELISSMHHLIVGLAISRALPGIAFAPHFINWSVIKGTTVYVNSYNLHDNETREVYPVDGDGNRIAFEDVHKASDLDPRVMIDEQKEKMSKAADGEDARRMVLNDAELAYQI